MSFLRHGKKGGFTTEAQRHRGRKRFTAKGAKVAKSSQRSAISIRPATFGAAWLVDALTHVEVVTAGVHHRDLVSGVVFGVDFARVGKSGVFFHRERIKFSAQQDGWPRAILKDADNPGATNIRSDFVSQLS